MLVALKHYKINIVACCNVGNSRLSAVRPRLCAVQAWRPALLQPVQGQGRQGGYPRASHALQGVREGVQDAQPSRQVLLRPVPEKGLQEHRPREEPPHAARRGRQVPHMRQGVQGRHGARQAARVLLGEVPRRGHAHSKPHGHAQVPCGSGEARHPEGAHARNPRPSQCRKQAPSVGGRRHIDAMSKCAGH